jgi:tryptophan halogenase
VKAEGFDPIALGVPLDAARARLSRIVEVTRAAVQHLPMHGEFIARHCATRKEQNL